MKKSIILMIMLLIGCSLLFAACGDEAGKATQDSTAPQAASEKPTVSAVKETETTMSTEPTVSATEKQDDQPTTAAKTETVNSDNGRQDAPEADPPYFVQDEADVAPNPEPDDSGAGSVRKSEENNGDDDPINEIPSSQDDTPAIPNMEPDEYELPII